MGPYGLAWDVMGVGEVGLTRVWYLFRAGVSKEEPIAELPWVAAVASKVATADGAVGATMAMAEAVGAMATTAAVVGGATTTTAVVGGTTVGGGDELRTLGRKACPPRVFTMVGQEEERRRRGEFQMGNGDLK